MNCFSVLFSPFLSSLFDCFFFRLLFQNRNHFGSSIYSMILRHQLKKCCINGVATCCRPWATSMRHVSVFGDGDMVAMCKYIRNSFYLKYLYIFNCLFCFSAAFLPPQKSCHGTWNTTGSLQMRYFSFTNNRLSILQ